ncbi:ATP-binding protein [Phenylobacterium sp.]|uniref:ATP-binding protein n=1 Tax=Phenylobacterium sp. TaxID=1871053 RepID=UPI003567D69F
MDHSRAIDDPNFADIADRGDLCRALLRCHPDCIQIVSPEGRLDYMSDNGIPLLETEEFSKIAGVRWASLWPRENRRKVLEAVVLAQSGSVARFQGLCTTSKLGLRMWDVMVAPIRHADQKPGERCPLLCVSRDITPLKEAAEKQAESERLEAIGRLTGGVAHDFNNLLTVVMGVSETLMLDLTEGSEQQKLAMVGLQAAERGADVVRRLLAFSRQQPLVADTIDCALLFGALGPMVGHTLPEDIELDLSVELHAMCCTADRVGLESALINLCVNARDAMPDGGALSLHASPVSISQAAAEPMGLRPGDYVIFQVRDTGAGMSAATLARAVEPFFTTKGVAGGSGLGLSTVYGFANQSGGRLAIVSEEGHGTTVSLYLPRAMGAATVEVARERATMAEGGHVLLVEDDAVVRAQVARPLSELGYRVTAVADGHAALAVIEGTDVIDLLFTDVVMPNGMNGRELADRAKVVRPDLKVLFTSGYTEDAVFRAARLDRSINFLAKPYRRSQLATAVAAAAME